MTKAFYKVLILYAISLLFVNPSAIAEANKTHQRSEKHILRAIPNEESKHKFSLGLELFPYSYKEPKLMKMKGLFYGINVSVR